MSRIQGRKLRDEPRDERFVRDKDLAAYLSTTHISIWRWRRDPELNFTKPSVINGISYTNLNEIDAWMRTRVVDRAAAKKAERVT